MKKIKSFLVLLGMMLSKKSIAAGAGGALSVVYAQTSGYDTLPWVVATIGAVVMFAKTEHDPEKDAARIRKDAIANGLISIVGGGLGGPFFASLIGVVSKTPSLESPLFMSFAFAAGWQFFVYKAFPELWPIAKALIPSVKKGGQ